MSDRRRELLSELEANPKAVRPEFLTKVLREFGYVRARQRGSHQVYTKAGNFPLVVPYRRPHLGRIYVEQVIARLKDHLDRISMSETSSRRREGEWERSTRRITPRR